MNTINSNRSKSGSDPSVNHTIRVNEGNLIRVVSRSLDFVGVDDTRHAHRTATMVAALATAMGYDQALRDLAYNAALLHDCGVSSTRERRILIDEFQWRNADNHALRGASYLESCTILRQYAPYIRYHHTPWESLKNLEISDEEKTVNALIFLCDRADALYVNAVHSTGDSTGVLLKKDDILCKIKERRGELFREDLTDMFLEISRADNFWLSLSEEFIYHSIFNAPVRSDDIKEKPISTVRNIATFLARIIDAKSRFTELHSERVALLAQELAKLMGVEDFHIAQLGVAGLMHDVGKLRIQDEVLDKQGPLSDLERAAVKKHCVDTRMVLDLLFPDSPIGLWAACHHEKIDGSGYPYGFTKDELDPEARILTVCDIFQALTQERPYRKRLSLEKTLGIMTEMEQEGQLDPDVVTVLKANGEYLYSLSTD